MITGTFGRSARTFGSISRPLIPGILMLAEHAFDIVSWPDKTREWLLRGTGLSSLSRITREWFASADDEVWVFSSDAESWRHMGGRAGLARVRKRVVIDAFVMVLN
jgi:hypothetical protein